MKTFAKRAIIVSAIAFVASKIALKTLNKSKPTLASVE